MSPMEESADRQCSESRPPGMATMRFPLFMSNKKAYAALHIAQSLPLLESLSEAAIAET